MNDQFAYLSDFQTCAPRFSATQAQTLQFLSEVHQNTQTAPVSKQISKLIERYGVKADKISSRSFECPDLYLDSSERKICHQNSKGGASIKERTDFFVQRSLEVLDSLYEGRAAPQHLIHVTCTGYASPSPAQKLVAKKSWDTDVSHAYHMGCYASLPALRLAWGQSLRGQQVDIVHNEMCSLHLHPEEHTPEQIVVQSLFADGHIRYRVSQKPTGSGFRVRRIEEKILPESADDMTWIPGPNGMMMTLSREVPRKIESFTREFALNLVNKSGLSVSDVFKNAIFAVHPGGPKIIDTVQQVLELSDEQIADSRRVLFERGNMSSATLPHIWQLVAERNLQPGTPVVSLAFGPGLTIFGSIFEVI